MISAIPPQLQDFLLNSSVEIYISLAVAGLITGFFGYKLYRLFLFLAGGWIGAITTLLVIHIRHIELGSNQLFIIIGIAIVCGLICLAIEKIGVFIVGAALGVALLAAYAYYNAMAVTLMPLVVSMIVGGILAIAIQKFIIILLSSLLGAAMVGPLVMHMTHNPEMLGWMLILTLPFMISQYHINPEKDKVLKDVEAGIQKPGISGVPKEYDTSDDWD